MASIKTTTEAELRITRSSLFSTALRRGRRSDSHFNESFANQQFDSSTQRATSKTCAQMNCEGRDERTIWVRLQLADVGINQSKPILNGKAIARASGRIRIAHGPCLALRAFIDSYL
jgi:hypothetical protein